MSGLTIGIGQTIADNLRRLVVDHLLLPEQIAKATGLQLTQELGKDTTLHVRVPGKELLLTIPFVLKGEVWVRLG